MAIVFGLSVQFGSNKGLAEQFASLIVLSYAEIEINNKKITLHKPIINTFRNEQEETVYEVSILPVGVSFGIKVDYEKPFAQLTSEDLTILGNYLYTILRGHTGYQIACVDFDADRFSLLHVQLDYQEEIANGRFHGLVVSHQVRHLFPQNSLFVPFDENHDWIPYQGTVLPW